MQVNWAHLYTCAPTSTLHKDRITNDRQTNSFQWYHNHIKNLFLDLESLPFTIKTLHWMLKWPKDRSYCKTFSETEYWIPLRKIYQVMISREPLRTDQQQNIRELTPLSIFSGQNRSKQTEILVFTAATLANLLGRVWKVSVQLK